MTYTLPWRAISAALFALSRANLLLILALVVLLTDPPVTPPVVARLVLLLLVLPAVAEWLINRAFAGTYEVQPGVLIVRRRDLHIEIPCTSIADVAPWRFPLPAPGVSLRMRSGRRLRYGLQPANPATFVAALVEAGVSAARTAAVHPTIIYAATRPPPPRWYHLLGKFVGFALLPAGVLFYTHQHIAYGGTLGEYYLYGLAAYLTTFAIHWGSLSIYLLLYAGVWRGLAEGAVLLTAWTASAHVMTVRRAVELLCRVIYYAGVPILLGLRYLS